MRNQGGHCKERLEICFGNTVRSMVSRRDGKLGESRKDGKSALAVSFQVGLSYSEQIARDHDHHFCKYR